MCVRQEGTVKLVRSLPSPGDSVVVESLKMYESTTTSKSITTPGFSGSKPCHCSGRGVECFV